MPVIPITPDTTTVHPPVGWERVNLDDEYNRPADYPGVLYVGDHVQDRHVLRLRPRLDALPGGVEIVRAHKVDGRWCWVIDEDPADLDRPLPIWWAIDRGDEEGDHHEPVEGATAQDARDAYHRMTGGYPDDVRRLTLHDVKVLVQSACDALEFRHRLAALADDKETP